MDAKELEEAFTKKLKDSAITHAEARKYRIEPALTPPTGIEPAGAGFALPYFDVDGEPIDFLRWRYLGDPRRGFARLTTAKAPRYTQPANTPVHVYFPPGAKWRDIFANSDAPIHITEGELKSLCATKFGFPTLGLGGVWSFRSAKRGQHLLPELADLAWSDRRVYLIFDSDAVRNLDVIRAENVLARELERLGARVFVVRLPELEGAKKTGVDDFLAARGGEALTTLIESAEAYQEYAELRRLNEEVLYVRDPGVIVRLDNMQHLNPQAFTQHAYSTRVYYAQVPTKDGGVKLEERSAPKEWLRWPQRAEVERLTFAPGVERLTEARELNTWKGWGVDPCDGDISPWIKLLDYLFAGQPLARQWFERWCAYPLRYPGTKMFTFALFWGRIHGTGKSLVGYSLMRIYGKHGAEIKDQDLHGSFNDWAQDRQFVMGDEITGGDKRGVADRLKSFITQQQLRINQKYLPVYTVPDCINYFFTSNHPDAFFLEDTDRRAFIHEIRGAPMEGDWYRKVYDPWYKSAKGAGALFKYFLELDLGDFDPRAPAYDTTAKLDMRDLGRSDLASWVALLRESPDSVLRIGQQVLPYKLWRTEDLLALYDPERRSRATSNGVARELRRQGFTRLCGGTSIPLDGGAYHGKLWLVRPMPGDGEGLAARKIGAIYDKERK